MKHTAIERDLKRIKERVRRKRQPRRGERAIGEAYKSLAHVERAFRSTKTVDLEVRPVFHYAADRLRAPVFLCMLANHLEWHMRQELVPILFDDHQRAMAQAQRSSPVAKARVSPAARRKAASKRTDDGLPVHSFRSLIADLATLTRNQVRFATGNTFTMLATATPVQLRAFDLLRIKNLSAPHA